MTCTYTPLTEEEDDAIDAELNEAGGAGGADGGGGGAGGAEGSRRKGKQAYEFFCPYCTGSRTQRQECVRAQWGLNKAWHMHTG